jgi:hypothetical protein
VALLVDLGRGIHRGRDAAQRDVLVKRDIVADFRRFADNHPHAVIDEQTATNGRAGVDFDAGQDPGRLGNKPRQDPPIVAPKRAGNAMPQHRVEAWIG